MQLSAQGTRGGILLAWRQCKYRLVSSQTKKYTLTATFRNCQDLKEFAFTAVYGPSNWQQREQFFEEIRQAQPDNNIPWAIAGDFNVTAAPEERNVSSNNWRATMAFAELISELTLLNLRLEGRSFTWSNDRQSPHLARLDRFLISADWNTRFPNSRQCALPNSSSDHCPLLLIANAGFKKMRFFRFENMWLRFPLFQDLIRNFWQTAPTAKNP